MKIVFAVLVLVVLVIFATILKNHAPLFDTPGPLKRLAVYLTTNTAATSDNHPFPELRTPVYPVGPDELYTAVKDAAISLGWSIIDSSDVEWRLHMVAKTHFLLFMDDVKVEIEPLEAAEGATATRTALNIHSHSRIGSADFAANADHIQQLVKAVNKRIEMGFFHSSNQAASFQTCKAQSIDEMPDVIRILEWKCFLHACNGEVRV
jgi:hypothetical protein